VSAPGAQISDVLVRLKAGFASWDLLDPAGNVRLTGQAEAGLVRTFTELTARGTWRLRLTLQNATGAYDVRWMPDRRPGLASRGAAIRFGLTPKPRRCST
jgi:hypothetical protein